MKAYVEMDVQFNSLFISAVQKIVWSHPSTQLSLGYTQFLYKYIRYCEIKSRIAMAKAAFNKKKTLFTSKLD